MTVIPDIFPELIVLILRELGDKTLAQLVHEEQAVPPVLLQEGNGVGLPAVEGGGLVDLLQHLLGEAGVRDGRVGHPHRFPVIVRIRFC